jgi:hypothetical protein
MPGDGARGPGDGRRRGGGEYPERAAANQDLFRAPAQASVPAPAGRDFALRERFFGEIRDKPTLVVS